MDDVRGSTAAGSWKVPGLGFGRLRLVLVALVLLMPALLVPGQVMASVLERVTVTASSPDTATLGLEFVEGRPSYRSFRLQDPERVVLDLEQTSSRVEQRDEPTTAPAVKALSVVESGQRVRLVATLNEPLEYQVSETDKGLGLQLGRLQDMPEPSEPRGSEERRAAGASLQEDYDGTRLSLNFQDIEVRAVLSTLADFTGLNIVASDSVTGRVTLALQDVPWDQALDLVLQSQGLASRQRGDVILVAPAEELDQLDQQRLEARSRQKALAPLVTEFIEVRYARAEELAQLLRNSEGFGLLSERGRVGVDNRTNTLLVQDTQQQLDQILETLGRLDIAVRQVQIEARIVIARDTATQELGINWGASSTGGFEADESGNQVGRDINPNGLNRARGSLALDLGTAAAAQSTFGFGYLAGDVLLDLELRALESEGKSQTISQPRIMTANQQTAVISQGEERAFQSVDDQGNPATEFKEAVLSLEVTPQITPDDRIIMDLVIRNDSFRESQFGGEPPIDTNTIETQVLAENGQTVVLGGILSAEELRQLSKTPLLGDLPVVGNLFRYTQKRSEKVELLVFITPRLLDNGKLTP